MERVKYNRVEVNHGNMAKKFPVYEIYLDGVIGKWLSRSCAAGDKR